MKRKKRPAKNVARMRNGSTIHFVGGSAEAWRQGMHALYEVIDASPPAKVVVPVVSADLDSIIRRLGWPSQRN